MLLYFFVKDEKKIDKELYYVIDEKNNQIELTDKGIEFLSGKEDPNFFIMPEIGIEISKIENKKLSKEDEAKEDRLYDSDRSPSEWEIKGYDKMFPKFKGLNRGGLVNGPLSNNKA